jgi:hypothetical protein
MQQTHNIDLWEGERETSSQFMCVQRGGGSLYIGGKEGHQLVEGQP